MAGLKLGLVLVTSAYGAIGVSLRRQGLALATFIGSIR